MRPTQTYSPTRKPSSNQKERLFNGIHPQEKQIEDTPTTIFSTLMTGIRILFMEAKQGPNILFYKPHNVSSTSRQGPKCKTGQQGHAGDFLTAPDP
jgi:hypothetical protein